MAIDPIGALRSRQRLPGLQALLMWLRRDPTRMRQFAQALRERLGTSRLGALGELLEGRLGTREAGEVARAGEDIEREAKKRREEFGRTREEFGRTREDIERAYGQQKTGETSTFYKAGAGTGSALQTRLAEIEAEKGRRQEDVGRRVEDVARSERELEEWRQRGLDEIKRREEDLVQAGLASAIPGILGELEAEELESGGTQALPAGDRLRELPPIRIAPALPAGSAQRTREGAENVGSAERTLSWKRRQQVRANMLQALQLPRTYSPGDLRSAMRNAYLIRALEGWEENTPARTPEEERRRQVAWNRLVAGAG